MHFGIIKAIAAHLYIAWIHPFGDGNGRVARLLEFAILLNCGVPSPAAHLLSNHYNMTRPQYYHQLDISGKTDNPAEFFSYAIEGFLDGLNEQLQYIEQHIMNVCWRDYVYEQFAKLSGGKVVKRRRDLALKISDSTDPTSKESLLVLMSSRYKNKTERTFSRDINELEKMKLVVRKNNNFLANKELMLQYLPFSRSLQKGELAPRNSD
jgi:Fic family protein